MNQIVREIGGKYGTKKFLPLFQNSIQLSQNRRKDKKTIIFRLKRRVIF